MSFISLGSDPGLSSPAVGIIERSSKGWALLDSPVLRSLDDLMSYLADCPFDVKCCSTENVSWMFTPGAAKGGVKSQYGSADILRVNGAVQLFATQRRIPFVEVMPATWRKRITGSGRSSKRQVREWVKRMVRGVPERIGLDRSDSIAIAIAGATQPGARR